MRHFLIYLLAVAIATLTFGGLALADSAIDPSFAATYTTSSSPATAATPAPSPTPVPKPSVSGSPPNVIQGKVMDAGRVWVMGEIRNNGSTPAYNVTAVARLLTDSDTLAGTANQIFPFLGPGDAIGYRSERAIHERLGIASENAGIFMGS